MLLKQMILWAYERELLSMFAAVALIHLLNVQDA